MDDWEVFFYDEETDCISSLTKYHAGVSNDDPQLLDNLVEAHPETIYFFARLQPHKDWDFNEYAGVRRLCDPPIPGLGEFIEETGGWPLRSHPYDEMGLVDKEPKES